jgi:hypothetical protein
MTTAVVFRLIEHERPTLLIDEADTFLHGKGDLRGILNSGHTPAGAFVWRCDGPEHQPRSYSTWCPMVIAGIGSVWPALQTRSIEIRMRRRRADEPIDPLTPGVLSDLQWLNQRAALWALDRVGVLQATIPEMPEGLVNRSRDNWVPLLAVANHAGGDWPERARLAAFLLSGGAEEQTRGVQLLTAIRKVFAGWEGHRIGSEDLCRALHDLEDGPWADNGGHKALMPRRLAAELKPFGISPRVFREGNRTPRGYEREQFLDAFARYLPAAA